MKVLPEEMMAMVLEQPGSLLVQKRVPLPALSDHQVLVKVMACGVCRTDLHIVDGELTRPKLPLIPGHEIVGTIVKTGKDVVERQLGEVVGIPWLGYTCGHCRYCLKSQENLCEQALFTGYTLDGGYAEYAVAFEQFCFPLPSIYQQPSAAPLLCAGLIGYRSYAKTGQGVEHLGIYGFGAAAHILVQLAVFQNKKVYAFTRDGDTAAQQFAKSLGAVWAGDASIDPPHRLDAAIIFAPVGSLVPKALRDTGKGGVVVCGGIHMSDIPSFPYSLLWEERVLKSVANLTRNDGMEFFQLAPQVPVTTEVQIFPLEQANEALDALRKGRVRGAAVLVMPR